MNKRKLFHPHLGWQAAPLTGLQKSFSEPGADLDGARELTPIEVIDELIARGEPGHSRTMYVNKGELRESLLEATQRHDVQVRYNDAAMVDRGVIRKGLLGHLYPDANLDPDSDGAVDQDGVPLVKGQGEDVVAGAYKSYTKTPGVDLKAAADELNALVDSLNRKR